MDFILEIFLVAKDTSNPAILKLVLLSLSNEWSVNTQLLSQNCLPENYSHLPESTQLYINANHSQNVSITSVQLSNSTGVYPFYSFTIFLIVLIAVQLGIVICLIYKSECYVWTCRFVFMNVFSTTNSFSAWKQILCFNPLVNLYI